MPTDYATIIVQYGELNDRQDYSLKYVNPSLSTTDRARVITAVKALSNQNNVKAYFRRDEEIS